jgi:3-oxoacyl-[acyl-carrier protein] reductase
MSALLEGKIALVTGASRGIGWAIAELFASHGAHLALGCRDDRSDLAARAATLAEKHGVEAIALPGDVADPTVVSGFYQTIFKRWKRLDILVNNAGILEDALLGMIAPEMVDRVLAVNTKGSLYNLQGAARLMTRGRSGSIINLTSIIGTHGNEGQVVYAASKAAIIGMTLSAAKELAPHGIRVNAIAPGYIDTDMTRQLAADKQAQRLAQIGMGRVGDPQDVAYAALYLAADWSRYVTGQILGVDGGMRI